MHPLYPQNLDRLPINYAPIALRTGRGLGVRAGRAVAEIVHVLRLISAHRAALHTSGQRETDRRQQSAEL
jgi:hypothetical protein